MRIGIDQPVNLSTLVEVYCDKTSQGLPSDKDNLLKMANRMRQVGLLTDNELRDMSYQAESIVKGFKV